MQKARKTVRSSMKQNFLRTRSLLDKLVDEVQQEANVAEKEEASEHRREAKAHKTCKQDNSHPPERVQFQRIKACRLSVAKLKFIS